MFKRPAWATSSIGPAASSTPLASSSSSTTSPAAVPHPSPSSSSTGPAGQHSAGHSDADFDSAPISSASFFRHATRSHDAIVAEQVAARRRKDADAAAAAKKRSADLERRKARRRAGEKPVKVKTSEHVGEDEKGDVSAAEVRAQSEDSQQKSEDSQQRAESWSSKLKRRRITAEDSELLLREAGMEPGEVDSDHDAPVFQAMEKPAAMDDSAVKVQHEVGGEEEEDDDDEVQIQDARPVPQPASTREEVDSDNDDNNDPELRELRRKARERHRQMQQHSLTQEQESGTSSSVTSATPDPAIQLLITSSIPDTKSLIVCRKLSQRLQEVRLTWCEKQGFTDQLTSQVFFTFLDRRKYDVTTVKSLGLEINALGNVTMRNGNYREEVTCIHLEAVTEEILARQGKEKARQAQQGKDSPIVEDAGVDMLQPQQQLIRLLIKAKGQKDLKLKVKPDTVISRIVERARQAFQIASNATAYLEFDGDRLNPEDAIANTEVEDMNCIDFYSS